ncbi:MAG: hypothetical protein ACOCX4_03760 [Planctomycetota bacterium]
MLVLCCLMTPGALQAGDAEPSLPPLPTAEAPEREIITAHASVGTKRLRYSPEAHRPTKDDYMPTGTLKKAFRLVVSGQPGFHHTEYHLPNTKFEMFAERYFGKTMYLPGGRVTMADGIGSNSNQNFGFWRWDFLHVSANVPGEKEPVSVLNPVLCVATATWEGDGWAAAEWHLRCLLGGPHGTPRSVTSTVRIKRVAGDPYLYVLIRVPEKEAKVRGLSLLSINRGGPSHLWYGGEDHLVSECKGQVISIDDDARAGGIWYNSETNQNRGCSAIFLPETAPEASAWGGHDGSLRLALRSNFVRLALLEWDEPLGWKAAVEPFIRELPERVQKLREMDFSCPVEDLADPRTRTRVDRLVASLPVLYPNAEDREMLESLDELTGDDDLGGGGDILDGLREEKDDNEDGATSWAQDEGGPPDPAKLRKRVESLQAEYNNALTRLRKLPRATTPERIAAEQRAVLLRYEIDAALAPALRDWLAKGGLFPEATP